MESRKKKKKGTAPSNDEAVLAIALIKEIEKVADKDLLDKQFIEEENRKKMAMDEIEKMRILEGQEKIRRKLKSNIEKKKLAKENEFKAFIESGNKIKWKSIDNGHKLQGYVNDKMIFEIKRGLTLFSLYIKDKKLINEKKIISYQGCSTNLHKLKQKSEKFI